MQSNRFAGRSAVVTGGASGMGRAMACRLAAEGASVAIWDVSEEQLNEVVEEVRDNGGNIHGFSVDIADAAAVERGARDTLSAVGAVTILMNNAGVLDAYSTILETDEQLWDRIMGVNLKGMFNVTRALLPSMIEAGGGGIVNTASIAAFVAGGGGIAYTSSKHAVAGFTKQMSFDYAKHGVRINAVAPGAVETGMSEGILDNDDLPVVQAIRSAPAGRHAQPEEIANLALFLVSDEADFVHGAVYPVDGGWTLQ